MEVKEQACVVVTVAKSQQRAEVVALPGCLYLRISQRIGCLIHSAPVYYLDVGLGV